MACPKGYEPNEDILKTAQEYASENNTEITITDDIGLALQNVDVVFTDVWVSMGDEAEEEQRKKDFAPFQVNSDLMGLANEGALFMHCLPAIRGQEVTSGRDVVTRAGREFSCNYCTLPYTTVTIVHCCQVTIVYDSYTLFLCAPASLPPWTLEHNK